MIKFKTFFCSIVVLFTFAILTFPVKADSNGIFVNDIADLLTTSEEKDISDKLENISNAYDCNVIILIVDSLYNNNDINKYSADYYEKNYSEEDVIMLTISMKHKDMGIISSGYCTEAFTDSGKSYMFDEIKSFLSKGKYYKAFDKYSELCNDFLKQAETGKPYGDGNLPREDFPFARNVLISLGVGIVIGFVFVMVFLSQLKTVAAKKSACDYIRRDSLKLTQKREIFLYKKIYKTKKSENNNKNSDSFESSSGKIYSGVSGKF